jgi:hypothetical protein
MPPYSVLGDDRCEPHTRRVTLVSQGLCRSTTPKFKMRERYTISKLAYALQFGNNVSSELALSAQIVHRRCQGPELVNPPFGP